MAQITGCIYWLNPRVEQTQSQQQQATATKHSLRNQIELQLWQAYFDLQTALQSIASSEIILHNSSEAAQEVSDQYRAGMVLF